MSRKYNILKSGRIQALRDFGNVKKGDIGGFIESEENLSHEGTCWVYGNAQVSGKVRISENAEVSGSAKVYGNAQVHGNAWVFGSAEVSGSAKVYGNARVYGNAKVYHNIRLNKGSYTFDVFENMEQTVQQLFDVVPKRKGVYTFYKRVNKTGVKGEYTSEYDKDFKYVLGKIARIKDYDESHSSCSSGLHVSTPFYWNSGDTLIECEVKVSDIITCANLKLRCKAVKPVREINLT